MILLSIEGMTCPSCVAHVKEALDAIEGVNKVEISYEMEKIADLKRLESALKALLTQCQSNNDDSHCPIIDSLQP